MKKRKLAFLYLKNKLLFVYETILEHAPGSELKRCSEYSNMKCAFSNKYTRCIRQVNHWGRHEDAWNYKWR